MADPVLPVGVRDVVGKQAGRNWGRWSSGCVGVIQVPARSIVDTVSVPLFNPPAPFERFPQIKDHQPPSLSSLTNSRDDVEGSRDASQHSPAVSKPLPGRALKPTAQAMGDTQCDLSALAHPSEDCGRKVSTWTPTQTTTQMTASKPSPTIKISSKHDRAQSDDHDPSKHRSHTPADIDNVGAPPSTLKYRRPLPPSPFEPHPSSTFVVPEEVFFDNPSSARSSALNPHPGSSRTAYFSSDLPPAARGPSPFREPELVVEEPSGPSAYYQSTEDWGDPGLTHWDLSPSWGPTPPSHRLTEADGRADGRDATEEEEWWDPYTREKRKRPGPGILPPMLADLLHNPDHTLFSVTASVPPPKHSHQPQLSHANISSAGHGHHHSSSSSTPGLPLFNEPPPTADEVRMAIPHPNAYYCKEHNGWILISWCSSSVLPPFSRSFVPKTPLPDQSRRKRTANCVPDTDQPLVQPNKTHHFHRYERAVNARLLTIPYIRSEWEQDELRKRRRRKVTLHNLDALGGAPPQERQDPQPQQTHEGDEDSMEDDLLDLYVCCQCSVYCLASQVIPGVIPAKFMDDLTKDKLSHPALDKTAHATVMSAWETFITISENKLFRGENRCLPIKGTKFQSKIGWGPVPRAIFDLLGFPLKPTGPTNEMTLHPANIDPSTPEGRRTRAKLLRGWVELSTYAAIFLKSKPKDSFGEYISQASSVKVESAREMYQLGIGAHASQIPRATLTHNPLSIGELQYVWEGFGITPTTYSLDLLIFAYFAQCRCDPANTPHYYNLLGHLYDTMKALHITPPERLETVLMEERSRGRWARGDHIRAAQVLGFGKDNELGVELDEEVDEEFILRAWKEATKRTWRVALGVDFGLGEGMSVSGSAKRVELNEAFKIVAEARGSKKLMDAWAYDKSSGMSPDAAFSTLGVMHDVDEGMLITVYSLRIEDQPSQIDKMKEAMSVIAEFKDSERLRQFLETGQDPGDVSLQVTMDMPRGLNQLGNTCYLNSLLQYFYTIKDLREAVAPLAITDVKALDEDKLSDDDLRRHRVGGRLVTRREIQRSKKFVNQLAELFWNLEYCDVPSVTPTIDLAKLALVTSQDEEEEEEERGDSMAATRTETMTSSSNDTDATLVDESAAAVAAVLSAATETEAASSSNSTSMPDLLSPSGSVLGKRVRTSVGDSQSMEVDVDVQEVEMDVDGPSASGSGSDKEKEGYVVVSKSQPPPLPPRKSKVTDDSVMMFGRQHDVSECMDNCMFQIETALLDFHDSQDDKTGVVKRLFYGKKRQRLAPLAATSDNRTSRLSMHEKEDLFSHLHVNVSEEGYDLYDGLSRYFDDIVEFEGVKRRMEVALVDLPPLLQIQLQRAQFDRETQQAYKSQAYVKFGETIYLDRFLDSAPIEKKAKAKAIQGRLNACRDRIYKLTQEKHAPFAPALDGAADFFEKQDALQLEEVDDDFVSIIRQEKVLVTNELEKERADAVKLKEELEALWKDDRAAAYELTSVFIHRGSSPSWGHYFFYSRNLPDKPDSWFKYNDSDVSVVAKDEVLADTTGSTANPYMLVFKRKDLSVIHTVHRFDATKLQELQDT